MALRTVDESGHELPPDSTGRLELLRPGDDRWIDTGCTGRIDAVGGSSGPHARGRFRYGASQGIRESQTGGIGRTSRESGQSRQPETTYSDQAVPLDERQIARHAQAAGDDRLNGLSRRPRQFDDFVRGYEKREARWGHDASQEHHGVNRPVTGRVIQGVRDETQLFTREFGDFSKRTTFSNFRSAGRLVDAVDHAVNGVVNRFDDRNTTNDPVDGPVHA